MKRNFLTIAASVAALTLSASCAKETDSIGQQSKAVRFSVCGMKTEITRGFTEVTEENLEKMYITATFGEAGSEKQFADFKAVEHSVNKETHKSVSPYYWPDDGSALNFYAVNNAASPVVSSDGVSFRIDTAQGDVVYASSVSSANGSEVALVFRHAFARLFDIKFYMVSEDAEATIDKLVITPGFVGGDLYLPSGSTSGVTAGSAQTLEPGTVISAVTAEEAQSVGSEAVDQLLLKDASAASNLTVKVTYTVRKPGYEKQFTKSAAVSLNSGESSTVRCALSDDASPITFNVLVTPWTAVDIDAELVEDK